MTFSASTCQSLTPRISYILDRPLFLLFVFWGALIIWLAPHPPMVDLPQHAGQVALLRDLLCGHSKWSGLFRINLATPYLIGYGLALPLSYLMSISAALKLLISLSYIGFIAMSVILRKRLNVDSRLDWLFLVSFFGFAFTWGFFTFLLAAPIGLLFIFVADHYAKRPTPKLGMGLLIIGEILLVSHGLIFLFAVGVGVVLFFLEMADQRVYAYLLPYILLLLMCGLYFLINKQVNSAINMQLVAKFSWNLGLPRIYRALLYSAGPSAQDGFIYLKILAIAVLATIPWMLGLKMDWSEPARWVPFIMVIAIMLLVPNVAWNTGFLYQRFALFLLPFYALMFPNASARRDRKNGGALASIARLRSVAVPLAIAMSALVLTIHTITFIRFSKETRDIDSLMSQIEPDARVAAIVLDQRSDAAENDKIYAHYVLWYQAEEHGLVDFNFGWLPPQIVRYRPDRLPGIPPGFDWHPERYDWKINRGKDYDYFFVRHLSTVPLKLFRGALCPPKVLKTEGAWTVFRRQTCPA